MDLKGKTVEKMPPIKKAAAKKTLKTMTKVRKNDDQYLREVTKNKLEYYEAEKKKGLTMIAQHENAIANLKNQVAKLDGAIAVLQEINSLPNEKEAKKEDK